MTHVAETGAGKMEPIYGDGFWNVCHGSYSLVAQMCKAMKQLFLGVN